MHEVVAGVVEVAGDGRGAERGGVRQHLLDAVRLAGVGAGRVAEMEPAGPPVAPGDALDLVDLARRGAVAHVAERRADAGGPRGEAGVEQAQDLVALFEVRAGQGPAGLVRAPVVQHLGCIFRRDAVENLRPREFVRGGAAVVDLVGTGACGVPVVHQRPVRADLEIHDGRAPIEQRELVAHGPGPVKMRVDEAGRDDMAARVDLPAALEGVGRDGDDPAVLNADIGDLIESRLRVHHAAPANHEVETLRHLSDRASCGAERDRPRRRRRGIELPAGHLTVAHVFDLP